MIFPKPDPRFGALAAQSRNLFEILVAVLGVSMGSAREHAMQARAAGVMLIRMAREKRYHLLRSAYALLVFTVVAVFLR